MFSVVSFAYIIKEDDQNVLPLLARKPWGTGMILWSRAAVSTLGRSHLVFIDPGVKIIGAYSRDVLLAEYHKNRRLLSQATFFGCVGGMK